MTSSESSQQPELPAAQQYRLGDDHLGHQPDDITLVADDSQAILGAIGVAFQLMDFALSVLTQELSTHQPTGTRKKPTIKQVIDIWLNAKGHCGSLSLTNPIKPFEAYCLYYSAHPTEESARAFLSNLLSPPSFILF